MLINSEYYVETNFDNTYKIGTYKAIMWPTDEITPPEIHVRDSYNSLQTDAFILGVLLFNMITPGYKPWAESATKDDPVF